MFLHSFQCLWQVIHNHVLGSRKTLPTRRPSTNKPKMQELRKGVGPHVGKVSIVMQHHGDEGKQEAIGISFR